MARSLRRSDQTLVRLAPGSDPSWLLGLLVPLALHNSPVALVVSPALRQRLLTVELPRLQAVGLNLPCWEGATAPEAAPLWLLQHDALVAAWQSGHLEGRQLVVPEGELLQPLLRQAPHLQLPAFDAQRARVGVALLLAHPLPHLRGAVATVEWPRIGDQPARRSRLTL